MVQTVQVPAAPAPSSGLSPVAYVANPPPAIPSVNPSTPSSPAPAIPAISSAPAVQPISQSSEIIASTQEQPLVDEVSPISPQPTSIDSSVDAEQSSEGASWSELSSCEESVESLMPAPVESMPSVPNPAKPMPVDPIPSMPAPGEPSVDAEQSSEGASWPELSSCDESATSLMPAPVEPILPIPAPEEPSVDAAQSSLCDESVTLLMPAPVEPMQPIPASEEPLVDGEHFSEAAPSLESLSCAESVASWIPAPVEPMPSASMSVEPVPSTLMPAEPAPETSISPAPAPVIIESTTVMISSPDFASTSVPSDNNVIATASDEIQQPSVSVSSHCEDDATPTKNFEFTGTPPPSIPASSTPQPAAPVIPAVTEVDSSENSSIDAVAETLCQASAVTVTVQADVPNPIKTVTETSYVAVYSYVLPYGPGPVVWSAYPEISAAPTQINTAPAMPVVPAPPAPTDMSSEPCTSL
ncbi:hypothetical protein H4S08_003370 [Coemansia sp. RSA 1365]|nr:hypothetical protein H4S08_003370 [Coemansia sp. RSA 1365]